MSESTGRAAVRGLWGRAAVTIVTVKNFLRTREGGNSVVEYALLLALLVLACLAAISLLGSSLANFFNNTASYLDNLVS